MAGAVSWGVDVILGAPVCIQGYPMFRASPWGGNMGLCEVCTEGHSLVLPLPPPPWSLSSMSLPSSSAGPCTEYFPL